MEDAALRTVAETIFERTDTELLEDWRNGDVDAMRAIVMRHGAVVSGPVSWLIEDPAACREAVVDVFTSLMDSDESLSPVAGLSISLTRRAIQVGEAWRRAHASERSRQAQALRETGRVGKPRPQDVVAALAELPTDFFVPLMLRYLESRSTAEIAEVCRKPERQIWGLIHQALEAVDHTIRGVGATRSARGGPGCDRVALLMMLEDELPARDRAKVAAHAEKCAECGRHEWRLSTLLAFLATIASMRTGAPTPESIWERIVARRGSGMKWRRASRMARRGAMVVGGMAAVAAAIVLIVGLAGQLPGAVRASGLTERAVETETSGAAPETPLDRPSVDAEAPALGPESEGGAPARETDVAWLPLPPFAGSGATDVQPWLRAVEPQPLGPPRSIPRRGASEPEAVPLAEAVAEPTEPTQPDADAEPEAPAAPSRAGWSHASVARGPATPPAPRGSASTPEDGEPDDGRLRVVLPDMSPDVHRPPLPSIVRGGQPQGEPAGASTTEPPSDGESHGTLADVLSRLADGR